MGLLDILGGVASAALSVVPGGSLALAAVNAFLPEEKQLPQTATIGELKQAHEDMPPELRVQIEEKYLELAKVQEEQFSRRYESMNKADGQSTRPTIALIMAWMLAIPYAAIGVAMAYAILMKLVELADMWPTLLAYLMIPMSILKAYFGILVKEQRNRIAGAQFQPPAVSPIAEIITGAKSLFGGRDRR